MRKRKRIKSFDSILVRLKVNRELQQLLIEAFRFHTGSIKRQKRDLTKFAVSQFRFHTGSIKSLLDTELDWN